MNDLISKLEKEKDMKWGKEYLLSFAFGWMEGESKCGGKNYTSEDVKNMLSVILEDE